jgi:hypothetical protein
MQFAIGIITGTPLWVWALLAFLLFIGIRGVRPTTASFARLAILPVVFLAWGLSGFATSYGLRPVGIAVWIAALVIGVGFGWLVARSIEIHADKERGLVRLPGNALNLVLILIIFATKYTLGVLAGLQPSITGELLYMVTDVGVSGLLTGMFAGRLLGLWRKYQATPHENLAA